MECDSLSSVIVLGDFIDYPLTDDKFSKSRSQSEDLN